MILARSYSAIIPWTWTRRFSLIFDSTKQHLQERQGLNASIRRRGTRRRAFPWGGRRDLSDGRRQGHTHRLEHLAARPLHIAPKQEPLAVLLHFHLLQAIQVLDHIR